MTAIINRKLKTVSPNNQWFNLRVNHNEINPLELVRKSHNGYNPQGWEYLGPKIEGLKIYHARLIHLGEFERIEEAHNSARDLGLKLVEGQAYIPFKARYPHPINDGAILFGGSEWQDPRGNRRIIMFGSDGIYAHDWGIGFRYCDSGFSKYWRWVVTRA